VSLLTAALAEARFASRVAVLIVDLDEVPPELASLVSLSRAVEVLLLGFDVVRLLGEVLAGVLLVGVVAVDGVLAGVVLVGVVLAGVVLAGAVAAGVLLGEVVVLAGLLGDVYVGAPATVAATLVSLTDAAEALPAPDPLELPPVELSPSVSSSLARLAAADCSDALACSSVTSAL
jgi:hypothetical protein